MEKQGAGFCHTFNGLLLSALCGSFAGLVGPTTGPKPETVTETQK